MWLLYVWLLSTLCYGSRCWLNSYSQGWSTLIFSLTISIYNQEKINVVGISKMIAWGENALILFLWKCLEISLGNLYESIGGWRVKSSQCAKQVVSDSLAWVRLVDFVIRLVIFVLNLPDGQVLFWGEIQITEGL